MESVLVDNFGKKDADDLMKLLQDEGIATYTKESGYGSFQRIKYGGSVEDRYVIVLMNQEDSYKAQRVLTKFRKHQIEKRQNMEMICPKCGQTEPVVIYKKLNFLQQIIYVGTKPKKCANCGNEWL